MRTPPPLRFRESTNMTDMVAALAALIDHDCPERGTALEEFYTKWENEPLVVLKWLSLQVPCQLHRAAADGYSSLTPFMASVRVRLAPTWRETWRLSRPWWNTSLSTSRTPTTATPSSWLSRVSALSTSTPRMAAATPSWVR